MESSTKKSVEVCTEPASSILFGGQGTFQARLPWQTVTYTGPGTISIVQWIGVIGLGILALLVSPYYRIRDRAKGWRLKE